MKCKNAILFIVLVILALGTSCAQGNPYLRKDVPNIMVGLQSPEAIDRKNAADALKAKGADAESAIPALTETLFDADESVRVAARDALVAIGPKAVVPLFDACNRAIKEKLSTDVISPICEGLDLFDENSIPAFIDIYNQYDAGNSNRYAVIATLNRMVDRLGKSAADAAPTLVSALGDPLTQIDAAEALTRLGKSAVPELIKGLTNPNKDIRYHSALVLGHIGPEAWQAESALGRALNDPVADVRAAAQLALERIGSSIRYTPSKSQHIQDLIASLKDPNPILRVAAAQELGKLGPAAKDALPALWQALQDPDEGVRKAAEDAIKKVQQSP